MTTLSLQLDVRWGGSIETVVRELVETSRFIKLSCVAKFNDVVLIAHPHDDPADIVKYYHRRKSVD